MTPVLSPIHGGHVSGTSRSFMKSLSDNWEELRLKVLGLGGSSVRKTHYPSLRKRLAELEQIRSKLQRSEAYLLEAQRLSHTGSFGWNVSSGEIYWSAETYNIFQHDRAVKPTLELVFQRIHPEDRAPVQRQIDRASRDGEGFDFEHRLQLPDGSVKHVRVTAHPSRDSAGNFEFVGAVTDVSEQRHAEAVIREQEAELRGVLDTIPAIVWSALPDGSNSYVNSRYVEYCGMPPEQIAGSGWQALAHPDDL